MDLMLHKHQSKDITRIGKVFISIKILRHVGDVLPMLFIV